MAGIYQNWDAAAYAELCQKFGLPDKKQYKDYSTGMKMKLCIAVALAHHPKLLLLDEATNGLDPVVRDEVTDLLLNFARDENHSILISSHIVSDLEKLCDTIAFLHKGRLLLCEEKDACGRNTPCGTVRRRSWRYWIRGCTASGSPPMESRRLCAGTQCPPEQSLPR